MKKIMRGLARRKRATIAVFWLAILPLGDAKAAAAQEDILRGFENPPQSAAPRVWWHWMNGNITEEGIRLDLEWMKRVGVGGAQVFDAALTTPQVVEHRLAYMTPEWKDAMRFAAVEADRLGLELAVASSPGWSETGGPWVKPNQAMKKLVWSETRVGGGRALQGPLPKPPSVAGPYQTVPLAANFLEKNPKAPPDFYADSAVVAYRLPADASVVVRPARITTSADPVDVSPLLGGDLTKGVSLPANTSAPPWIQYEYDQPQTIRSMTVGLRSAVDVFGSSPFIAWLEVRDDNGAFRKVAEAAPGAPRTTIDFPSVTAKVFRVTLIAQPFALPGWLSAVPGANMGFVQAVVGGATPKVYSISELTLQVQARVNEVERKAGFAMSRDYYAIPTPEAPASSVVRSADVIDLTGKMRPNGALDWVPPAGKWAILRMGYSLTGTTNHPATAEATGLEVDKLNGKYVQDYMLHYLDSYSSFLGTRLMGRHGVRAVVSDSTEVGPQNWTDDMLAQFQRLNGYDPRPWLPVLTGVIVDGAEASDKFLWDFRRALADLTADQHYAVVARNTHAHGMTQYGESLEGDRPSLGDDVEMRRFTDVPMAAMWTYPASGGPRLAYVADDRGAASVAHVYGQNLAAAESFTASLSPWAFSPRDLKTFADLEFVLGINRIVVHTSVHQPLVDKAPGLTLGIFGQYFNRNETWAEQAGPWVSYLSRSAYLLQQGRYAADVAYFYGQEAPLGVLQEAGRLDDAPTRYGFDFVGPDALLNLLGVKDGALLTPSGMRYRVLYLGGTSEHVTLAVLRKLRDLVLAGAVIVGKRPVDSPSQADDNAVFQQVADELWGHDGAGGAVGLGRVYGHASVEMALKDLKLAADFEYSKPHDDTRLLFLHRRLPGTEIYFVTNRRNQAESLDATFRVAGLAPELWHAETGKSEPATYHVANGRTVVSLTLKPDDAVFVVFCKPTSARSFTAPTEAIESLAPVDSSWKLAFQPDRGAPASITLDHLASWTDSSDAGVKYFSGTAVYTRSIDAPPGWFKPGAKMILDLGDVRELAEVYINGRKLGIIWKPPFRFDMTGTLKPGSNAVEIRVTNLWVNRLIGDEQPGATKHTFTTDPPYIASAPLRPSGLIGPVTIERSTE